jgi:peptidyl-tRNA hydrolase, PTH1 family
MKLIVGLGNPSEKYDNSRHNLGYLVLDSLLQKEEKLKRTFWTEEKKFKALVHEITLGTEKIILLKPTTFMNDSGISVQGYSSYFKIDPQDIVVVHDELDMPLGKIRIRFGGSGGGHNGVNSIIERLGTDKFLRLRLGIGKEARRVNPQHDTSDYVLGTFETHEKSKVRSMVKQAVKNILLLQKHGIDLYMSKYNS